MATTEMFKNLYTLLKDTQHIRQSQMSQASIADYIIATATTLQAEKLERLRTLRTSGVSASSNAHGVLTINLLRDGKEQTLSMVGNVNFDRSQDDEFIKKYGLTKNDDGYAYYFVGFLWYHMNKPKTPCVVGVTLEEVSLLKERIHTVWLSDMLVSVTYAF